MVGLKLDKCFWWKRLGKDVRPLVFPREVIDYKRPIIYFLTYEVQVQSDMLKPNVSDRISCDERRSQIIH